MQRSVCTLRFLPSDTSVVTSSIECMTGVKRVFRIFLGNFLIITIISNKEIYYDEKKFNLNVNFANYSK